MQVISSLPAVIFRFRIKSFIEMFFPAGGASADGS
jgi:hypothetical protein